MIRRQLILAAGFLPFLGIGVAAAAEVKERVYGEAEAPVTIVEYASMSCSACAHFHTEVWPAIKENYIDTGKAKLVFRDYPLDEKALAGSILAHCAGPDRFFRFVDFFFANQQGWTGAGDWLGALRQQSRLGGLSDAEMDSCLSDSAMQDEILRIAFEGQQEFGVESTPTFVINGEVVRGVGTVEQFSDMIEKQLD
jgi:protein-disulfide isomerase